MSVWIDGSSDPLHATVAFGSVNTGRPGVTASASGSKCVVIASSPVPSNRMLKSPPPTTPAIVRIILTSQRSVGSNASTSDPFTTSDSPASASTVTFLPPSARYRLPDPSALVSGVPSPVTARFSIRPMPCSSTPSRVKRMPPTYAIIDPVLVHTCAPRFTSSTRSLSSSKRP